MCKLLFFSSSVCFVSFTRFGSKNERAQYFLLLYVWCFRQQSIKETWKCFGSFCCCYFCGMRLRKCPKSKKKKEQKKAVFFLASHFNGFLLCKMTHRIEHQFGRCYFSFSAVSSRQWKLECCVCFLFPTIAENSIRKQTRATENGRIYCLIRRESERRLPLKDKQTHNQKGIYFLSFVTFFFCSFAVFVWMLKRKENSLFFF